MKILSIITILLFFSFGLVAQESGQQIQDIVYLKDGSVFRGKILDYQPNKSITIETWSGQQLTFDGKSVKKVKQELIEGHKSKKAKTYDFREKGFYNSTDISLGWAEGEWEQLILGASISNVFGYQFNRFIGTGIGVGFDTHRLISREQFIPVFVEARGYFMKKSVTPMYRYQIGYGFGLKDLERDLFKSEGGLYSYPAIGVRFGNSLTFDIGYKLQLAKQHYRIWEGIEVRKMTYNRFTLRCGVQF